MAAEWTLISDGEGILPHEVMFAGRSGEPIAVPFGCLLAARHVMSRVERESRDDRVAAEQLVPLEHAGLLELVDPPFEPAPGLRSSTRSGRWQSTTTPRSTSPRAARCWTTPRPRGG